MKTKGLTIQEAILSGLPFKREKELVFIHLEPRLFTKDEVMATDWEIKVPEVTITREKLAEAWDNSGLFTISSKNSPAFDAFAKELGL